MPERRYTEAEVTEIFRRATESPQPMRSAVAPAEGMTLTQLQEIGREVGVAGDAVASAARSLNEGGTAAAQTFIGLPIGVGRTVNLDRKLSDAEWEQLVVDLRSTFDARGRVKQEGSFRQWTNGNLQALVEPTPSGDRLRLKTLHAGARAYMMGGIAVAGVAIATLIGAFVSGGTANLNMTPITEMALIGAGLFAVGSVRLPGWARLRQRQMKEIADRVSTPITTDR